MIRALLFALVLSGCAARPVVYVRAPTREEVRAARAARWAYREARGHGRLNLAGLRVRELSLARLRRECASKRALACVTSSNLPRSTWVVRIASTIAHGEDWMQIMIHEALHVLRGNEVHDLRGRWPGIVWRGIRPGGSPPRGQDYGHEDSGLWWALGLERSIQFGAVVRYRFLTRSR